MWSCIQRFCVYSKTPTISIACNNFVFYRYMEHADSDRSSSSDDEEDTKDKDDSEVNKEEAERHIKSVVLPCYLNR